MEYTTAVRVLLALVQGGFDGLQRLKREWVWPAPFSTNETGEVWLSTAWGWTPKEQRIYVNGFNGELDRIAARYLQVRPGGGRFWVDDAGPFWKLELKGPKVRF